MLAKVEWRSSLITVFKLRMQALGRTLPFDAVDDRQRGARGRFDDVGADAAAAPVTLGVLRGQLRLEMALDVLESKAQVTQGAAGESSEKASAK